MTGWEIEIYCMKTGIEFGWIVWNRQAATAEGWIGKSREKQTGKNQERK